MTQGEEAGAATLRGIGVSPGIAIGRALVLEGPDVDIYRRPIDPADVDREVRRFQRAVRGAWRQLRRLRDRIRDEAGEPYAQVFEAQIQILRDRVLLKETTALLRRERVNAEWAFHTVVGRYTKVFAQLGDAELRERGTDIEDVEARVQALLTGSRKRHDLSDLEEDVIVVAPALSPSDAATLSRERVIGLALDGGGPTAHTAILAAALGIPAVAGLPGGSRRVRSGDLLVLDGTEGFVWINPPESEAGRHRARRAALAQRELDLLLLRDQPAVTREGLRIRLMANIELPEEMRAARRHGAEGVGLYRSEFLYLKAAPDLPEEEEQYAAYRSLAEQALPHEVVIRTLDLGGEKYARRFLERAETIPVLGLRGIRLSLRRPDLFRTQIRAILRAAAHGKVRMMFPMVSGIEEVLRARALVDAVREELSRERVPFAPALPIGIMVEVPGAALMAGRMARHVDFLSIGTNDLIQYALAIDRGNEAVSYLYEPLHPAILTLVRGVVEAAGRQGLRLSVCGEMAANPLAAAVLVGLGVTELSLSPPAIPLVKQTLRSLSLGVARAAVEEAMGCDTAAEVAALMRQRLGAVLPAPPAPLEATR